jgi:integrase
VGLYKLCEREGRARDRCEHAWWARFRHVRVSLEKWANREIKTKTDADTALDELKNAVRAGTFDKRGIDPPREVSPQTFREFAQVYKERHVLAKRLALARSIDYRLKPLIEHFGDRPLESIRTADIEDFIADLRKPRIVNRRKGLRTLAPASINRTIELMRHMLNLAIGREYLDRTPFRRGTETLIRKLQEDNRRRRRISEDEETRLLEVAPPFLRSMIITALDTGTRQGEMLALRFGDIDWKRQLIVLRGQTLKRRSAASRTRGQSRTSGTSQSARQLVRLETQTTRRSTTVGVGPYSRTAPRCATRVFRRRSRCDQHSAVKDRCRF